MSDDDPVRGQDCDPMASAGAAGNKLSNDDLQREQLQLANEKLRIETRKLANEAIPEKWWSKLVKNVVAVGGVLTVAATAYGLYDSYDKTIRDRRQTRATDQRTQFEDAIKKLESKSTISKLVAVSVLSGYLGKGKAQDANDSSFNRQILFTFAGVVATESDSQTQAAILDLLTAQPVESIAPEDWSYFQDMLVSQSRALVAKGNLYRRRQFGIESEKAADEEIAAGHVGRLIALNVRKEAVPSYKKYRGVYCEGCNFRDARFPKGTDFTAALLDRADFRGATLDSALFDNAEMGGTVFARSYLKGADFRTLAANHVVDGLNGTGSSAPATMIFTPYLQHIQALLESRAVVRISMPDFSCANLQDARFDNLSLFNVPSRAKRVFAKGDEAKGGWRATLDEFRMREAVAKGSIEFAPLIVTPPSFYRADLSGAHLDAMRYFSLTGGTESSRYFSHAIASGNAEWRLWEGEVRDSLLSPPPLEADGSPKVISSTDAEAMDQSQFQGDLRMAFVDARLSSAVLPDRLGDLLKVSYPAQFDLKRGFQYTFKTNGEFDWDCETRTSP